MLPFTGSSQLQQQQTSNYPRPPRATDDPSRHSTVSAAPVGGRPDLATVETTARGPLHPLRGAAPDQKRCTAYGSGAAHPITRTNAESARREPGCGTRGRRQGLAGLRGYAPSEARGADGSRAGRRPRAHKAARPGTTARGPLHPLRAAAPVTGRCTRSEGVHCLRIGCTAYGSGAPPTLTSTTVANGPIPPSQSPIPHVIPQRPHTAPPQKPHDFKVLTSKVEVPAGELRAKLRGESRGRNDGIPQANTIKRP